VILTLADKGVLDEEDGDELENVLAVSLHDSPEASVP